MTFKQKIIELEEQSNHPYIIKDGTIPILLTAPHTMRQQREDGTIKLSEPFTKAITMYVANNLNTSFLIKIKDTGVDANSNNKEYFTIYRFLY